MKISYKNTALGILDDPKFNFSMPTELNKELSKGERFRLMNSLAFSNLKDIIGNNIQYVSTSFWEAYSKYRHKLADIFDKETLEESGALITIAGSFTHTYFYSVKTYITEQGWQYDCMFMDFSKHTEQDCPSLDVLVTSYGNTIKQVMWKEHEKAGRDHTWWEAYIITFVLFKKFCEIETKIVDGGRKVVHAGQKYKNETNKPVKIIDSTWFTTLVRTAGFMVGDETGGFLALRYFGPGKTQKRLVWIEPFEKQGYTRKAKILSQNNQ